MSLKSGEIAMVYNTYRIAFFNTCFITRWKAEILRFPAIYNIYRITRTLTLKTQQNKKFHRPKTDLHQTHFFQQKAYFQNINSPPKNPYPTWSKVPMHSSTNSSLSTPVGWAIARATHFRSPATAYLTSPEFVAYSRDLR